jgi:hypothetical protein
VHGHAVLALPVLEEVSGHLTYQACYFRPGTPGPQDGIGEADALGDVQWHQRYRQASLEHDIRRLGVDKYIKFRHGRRVPRHRNGASHNNQTPKLLHGLWGLHDGARQIGERA